MTDPFTEKYENDKTEFIKKYKAKHGHITDWRAFLLYTCIDLNMPGDSLLIAESDTELEEYILNHDIASARIIETNIFYKSHGWKGIKEMINKSGSYDELKFLYKSMPSLQKNERFIVLLKRKKAELNK